jgi:nicotinate-nucleotide adenylyltransferase
LDGLSEENGVRIAVYGGSFNPPHRAHALVASWLVSSGTVEQVWLVPVFQHAFEGVHGKALAPYAQRIVWCTAMAEELGDRVVVSEVESRLPAPSYTIDTLQHLSTSHPEHRFRLVVGADILSQTTGWKSWDKIVEDHPPIVVGRSGYSPGVGVSEGVPTFPAVSSTDVRARLMKGEGIAELVTPAVERLLFEGHPWQK